MKALWGFAFGNSTSSTLFTVSAGGLAVALQEANHSTHFQVKPKLLR